MWPCVFVSAGTAISLVVQMRWTYRTSCSRQVNIWICLIRSPILISGASSDEELVNITFQYLGIILHGTKGLSCAIESLATTARKAMWALFPRFKLAGISDIAIKLRMFSYLVVPIMEYYGEVWGPDLLFSCDTIDKICNNEFLRQLGKLRKSVATTIIHEEMFMDPVAKGWVRASIDLWYRLCKVPATSLLSAGVRESLVSYSSEPNGSTPKSWAGRFMHMVKAFSQGRDPSGAIGAFLDTNGVSGQDNGKLVEIPWVRVLDAWDAMLEDPWGKAD